MIRTQSATHLVLGGTAGIGRAYAEYCAANHGALRLVARNLLELQDTGKKLLAAGATGVESFAGDLREATFRSDLRRRLTDTGAPPLRSVLIGGPSPPAGSSDEIALSDMDVGYDICIRYPLEMMQWALSGAMCPGGEVIVVSSSASSEPLQGSPFFVSALFRRALDQLTEQLRPKFEAAGLTLTVWRPQVVVTRLSLAYAHKLSGSGSPAEQVSFLARRFNVAHVPSAAEFVQESLKRGSRRKV